MEERIRSSPTSWIEIEDLVERREGLWKNTGWPTNRWTFWQKKGAACGGPPQELIQAFLERAKETGQQQEMAIAILEQRDHLVEIAPRVEQDPEIADDVGEMRRPAFYRVLDIHCTTGIQPPAAAGGRRGLGTVKSGATSVEQLWKETRWKDPERREEEQRRTVNSVRDLGFAGIKACGELKDQECIHQTDNEERETGLEPEGQGPTRKEK